MKKYRNAKKGTVKRNRFRVPAIIILIIVVIIIIIIIIIIPSASWGIVFHYPGNSVPG